MWCADRQLSPRPRRRRRHRRVADQRARGLTLIELVIVIALLGLIVIATAPQWGDARESQHLQQSAERVRAMVAMCRAQAMNEGRIYRLEFRLDGTIRLRMQYDPLDHADTFVRVTADWARLPALLPNVWVAELIELPEGPPPILIDDEEELDFETYEEEDYLPEPLDELESPVRIDFQPDGTSSSLRWVLRDTRGRGMQMTLDGRMGRVQWFKLDPIDPETQYRPEPTPEDEEQDELDELRELEAELADERDGERF
jgi:prepilin-type N-terminal cleavage/methylation domain-containing protein